MLIITILNSWYTNTILETLYLQCFTAVLGSDYYNQTFNFLLLKIKVNAQTVFYTYKVLQTCQSLARSSIYKGGRSSGQSCYQIERRDPLAELSSSLHTWQSAACDGDSLEMKCPAATKISIQLVQYGRLTPDDGLCPANIRYPGPRTSITGDEDSHQQVEILNKTGGVRWSSQLVFRRNV